MELIKKYIRTNQFKGKTILQMTLDDDFTVPDIDQIIEETGEIRIHDIRVMKDKALVTGKLLFDVLYTTTYMERPVHSMSGEIEFEEMVNMDGLEETSQMKIQWDMEDLRATLVNNKKISVRSVVTLTAVANQIWEEEAATGVVSGNDMCALNKVMDISQIRVSKKDTMRIKEEITIPSNKPNIMGILWSNAGLQNIDTKLTDDGISIRGDISLFVLYSGPENENPIHYVESEIPFRGVVPCSGVKEEMIPNIIVGIMDKILEIRPDGDGEDRNLSIEIVLELDISVYEDERIELLQDVYSPRVELVPEKKKAEFDHLLVRNQSRCKVKDRIKIKNDQAKVLQIYHTGGNVKIDRTELVDDGILVEGVIYVQMLYVAADDKEPVNALKSTLPFSHTIEVKGIKPGGTFDIYPALEQISSVMIDSEEVDVAAAISLNTICFENVQTDIISGVAQQPWNNEVLENMPNIVGYIVKEGDTLWNLSKEFFTTQENIMELNELQSPKLTPGDRLVLIKNAETIN